MTENYYKFGSEGDSFRFDYDTQELCCVLCKDKYNVYNDPFILVIDTNSFIEVTYELCIKCIRSFQKCNKCNRELNEPWDRVYFNIIDKTYYCQCCYDDKRNKFYKKCYNSNCLYCCEKYNIKTNVITCIYKELIELSKLELTDISQGYLMELIAQQIDITEDENIVKELDNIYQPELRQYSMYNYKDSEVNKKDLYILTGYILDNNLSKNDLQVKKIVLREYIKYYKEHHNILSLEEIKKYI